MKIELYGIKIVHNNSVEMKHIKKLRKKLYSIKKLKELDLFMEREKENRSNRVK